MDYLKTAEHSSLKQFQLKKPENAGSIYLNS